MLRAYLATGAIVALLSGGAFAQSETTATQSTVTSPDGAASETQTSKSADHKGPRGSESYEWSKDTTTVTGPVVAPPPVAVERSTTTTTTEAPPPPVVTEKRTTTTESTDR